MQRRVPQQVLALFKLQKHTIMRWIKNNRFVFLGALLGAIAGFLYWKFIGCSSGTCAITSKPLNSTLYGALLGGTLISAFTPINKQKNNPS